MPTERRVREMHPRDYLWCAVNLLLDEEEQLGALCPACRAEAERACCPVCGREVGEENPAFDLTRFLRLQGGDGP